MVEWVLSVMSPDWSGLHSGGCSLLLLSCMDAQKLVFFYPHERLLRNMDRGLFEHVGHHGFSSLVSSVGSLRRCNQLPSPLSLVRTLVVWNTAALSPSERQTRACHTPTHHLMYYTHCRLHHNDILISVCLMARMKFNPPLGRHTAHNQPLVFYIKSGPQQKIRIERVISLAQRRTLCTYWRKQVISHSVQITHLLTWLFKKLLSLLPSAVLTGHLKVCRNHIETGMVLKDNVKSEGSNYDTVSFKMVVPTPCSLTIRNMCSLRNSCVILLTCRKSCPTTFPKNSPIA